MLACAIYESVRGRISRQGGNSTDIQPSAQPDGRRHQNIRLPCLDLLQRSDIQVRQLGQFLLGYAAGHAFAPKVPSENLQLAAY